MRKLTFLLLTAAAATTTILASCSKREGWACECANPGNAAVISENYIETTKSEAEDYCQIVEEESYTPYGGSCNVIRYD